MKAMDGLKENETVKAKTLTNGRRRILMLLCTADGTIREYSSRAAAQTRANELCQAGHEALIVRTPDRDGYWIEFLLPSPGIVVTR